MQAVGAQSPGWVPGPSHPAPEPLARLLMQWGVAAPPLAPVAERLGGWMGWADAILLSQVLATPTPPVPGHEVDLPAARDWAAAALDRVQTELRTGFVDDELAQESAEPLPDAPAPLADLLAPYRLHHAQQQRAIAARVASLRDRLRERLAASPSLAQLASLDAVFDRAIGPAERQALTALPTLLTRRAEAHAAADPRRWRARLWADLQRLLLAELDLRIQPVLGLIEALHPKAP